MSISIVRTIILYLLIVLSMRIMGKRQLGQLAPSELVVAVMISDIASNPLQSTGIPLLYGILPVLTLVCCEILISGAITHSIRFRSLLCGRPSMLIRRGTVIKDELDRNRMTLDELMMELRKSGVRDIMTVHEAVLESDGTVSVMTETKSSPATPEQLGLTVRDEEYPVMLISRGRVLNNNLKLLGRNEKWLYRQLSSAGACSPREIYLMTADKSEKIYILKTEDAK